MKSKAVAFPYLAWMAIFVIVPLGMIVYFAFTNSEGNFSIESILSILQYGPTFVKSLWLALIATVICLLMAYPMAYMLSRSSLAVQKTMTMLVMLPMWMNFLLRIYAWRSLLEKGGLLSSLLSVFGFEGSLAGNSGAVILGMVYNFFPFMLLPLYTVMTKIDNSVIEAAEDLGSNTYNVFRKVVIPLSVPGIISGITMVFVPAASTFLISQYLGGSDNMLIGDIIEKEFLRDKHVGSALSLILMIIMFIFIGIMNKVSDDDNMEGMII